MMSRSCRVKKSAILLGKSLNQWLYHAEKNYSFANHLRSAIGNEPGTHLIKTRRSICTWVWLAFIYFLITTISIVTRLAVAFKPTNQIMACCAILTRFRITSFYLRLTNITFEICCTATSKVVNKIMASAIVQTGRTLAIVDIYLALFSGITWLADTAVISN